ncbi:MAG: tRNA glutamyl-Q(34) synthetase GluQRS [Aestuariivita sp.]|nr:tRNA glutamyl-Q(34) synthetase GluQRS [Aestuariivita sp.]
MTLITRFAPSPTGLLHLGHAYSVLFAYDLAQSKSGVLKLRIEDIDTTRSRKKWGKQVIKDLKWLGIEWAGPIVYQSHRIIKYQNAIADLSRKGLIYQCNCTRKDIEQALSAPQIEGNPDLQNHIYPGTCRSRVIQPERLFQQPGFALRLNLELALAELDQHCITFFESKNNEFRKIEISKEEMLMNVGDFILSSKDFFGSYHLSVVIDDAEQGITDVVRGEDLFSSTKIHVLLQRLLGYQTPKYHHHTLIRDDSGRRLAKRDNSRSIAYYRAMGTTPTDIRKLVGLY